jgi:hypothetical protein
LIDDGKSFDLGFAFANGSTNLGQSPKRLTGGVICF